MVPPVGPCLMKPLFEPMTTCDLWLHTKDSFYFGCHVCLAIQWTLCPLIQYLQFLKDKVIVLLPKMISHYHLSQPIILPTFVQNSSSSLERKLHILDVQRALGFYISRTSSFCSFPKMFVCYSSPAKRSSVSTHHFSCWVVLTVELSYQLAKCRCHNQLMLILRELSWLLQPFSKPLPEVCRSATWSQPSTFVHNYRTEIHDKTSTAFGRAVISTSLVWHHSFW